MDGLIDGSDYAESTALARMSSIERLYAFVPATARGRDLDGILASQDLSLIADALHAFFAILRNEASRTGRSQHKAWRRAVRFATGLVRRIAYASGASDEAHQSLLLEFERLSHGLVVAARRRSQRPRGLPAGVIEDLYELTDPRSKRNPFRTDRLRHRNLVIVLLLLHQGLRRGELLNLAVDCVCDEFDTNAQHQRIWLDVCMNRYEAVDPRGDPPSLKNDLAPRKIPLSEPLAIAVDTYVHNYRGRRSASYLFYSQHNKALAKRTLGKLFQVLSSRLSAGAKRELWRLRRPLRVTPHDLRHTCAAVRLHQLVGDDDARLPFAMQVLRPFFGWERDSEMPQLYARTYFEHRLASVWRADFDARVDFLRSIR